MCGIVGVIGWPINQPHLNAFHTLFYLNQLRGGDGVGLISANSTTQMGRTRIDYATMRDHNMTAEMAQQYDEDYEKMTTQHPSLRAVVGRCRSATVGGVKTENNHPIIVGDLIGVHNGTIKNTKYNVEGKTDSQVLYETIDAIGWEDTYKEIENEPYALAWFDKTSDHLTLTRSKDRPLACLKLNEDVLFFASDWRMLDFMARHHALPIPKGGLFTLMPDEMAKFDMKAHAVSTPVYVGPSVVEKKVG